MNDVLTPLDNIIWYVAFLILIPLGIYFSIKLKGVQITGIGKGCKHVTEFKPSDMKEKKITSFESFIMGLGARVGVGNIAGVASAIIIGGPGAIFWMWVFAIITSVLGFAEAVASQMYKEKDNEGHYVGGPPFYIKKALGDHKMAMIMAVLLIALYGVGIIIVNASICMDEVANIVPDDLTFIIVALAFTGVIAAIIIGGIKRVAIASTFIVPVMLLAWLVICVITLAVNWQNIGNAFGMIFHYAFNIPSQVAEQGFLSIEGVWEGFKGPIGGLLGTVITLGLRKSAFSNEAGVGSISVLSGSAHSEHPVKVGLLQSLGVLIDTLVVCTLSAITILSFGNFDEIWAIGKSDAPLVTEIISRAFLGDFAGIVLTAILFACVLSSVISFYSIVETTSSYISKDKDFITALKAVIIISILIGCFVNVKYGYAITEILMALCAIPHMIVIYKLRRNIIAASRDYHEQRKNGVSDPVFKKDAVPDKEGITEWD